MSKLVVVGSLNSDLTIAVDHLPVPGETIMASSPAHVGFGGKGGNQASAAASMGGDVAMVARVGDDDAGTSIRSDLDLRGIGTSLVLTTAGTRTGSAVVIVDRSGDNVIVVDAGANATLGPSDVANTTVVSAAAVLVQLEIPMVAVTAALRAATGLVVLNPAPASALEDDVFSLVDVLVPNRTELGQLTGSPPPTDLEATRRLVEKLPFDFDVVVTLGATGALVVGRRHGRTVLVPAPRVNVIDATGAGDAFCGALVVGLAEHGDLEGAASLAVAAASLSTTALGARGLLATRREAEPIAASLHAQVLPRF
jgi:ribokinase